MGSNPTLSAIFDSPGALGLKKVDIGVAALSVPIAIFIGHMLVTLYLMFFAPDDDIAWTFAHSWRRVLLAALGLYIPTYMVLRRGPPGWLKKQLSVQFAFGLALLVLLGLFFALNILAS